MKLISNAHVDSHSALLALVNRALPTLEARVQKESDGVNDLRQQIEEYNSLPWYRQLFHPGADSLWQRIKYTKALDDLVRVQKIRACADWELTIELDEDEVSLLLRFQSNVFSS